MRKLMILVVFFAATVKAEYNPGYWGETSIPKDIFTQADYEKYRKTREATLTGCFLSGLAAIALIKYSRDMKKKANRIIVTEPFLVSSPSGSYYPRRQSSIDYKARMISKSKGAGTAGTILAVATLFLGGLTLSISF
jgi:hypothetical protein